MTAVPRTRSRWIRPASLVLAGMTAGGILAASLSANASTPSPTPSPKAGTSETADGRGGHDGHDGHGPGTPASAAATTSVTTAVLAKYPGAKVGEVALESDGTYEADVTTTDAKTLDVALDKAFAVTGSHEEGLGHGGPGGHSNTDPAHEAKESAKHAAEEKANDAGTPATTG